MGRKTHGPKLIAAIEYNDIQKVSDILSKHFRDRAEIKHVLTSEVPRLAFQYHEVPLLLAATLPDPSIIRYFVTKHDVDINHLHEFGFVRKKKIKTALIVGVRAGKHETVEGILNLNADPNVPDHKGRRALHHAVRKADFRMAKILISHGAQADLTDVADNTALHVASIFGHVELVKLLVRHGSSDVYKKGQHGALAIHMAAHEGHSNLVRLFCMLEVNPNIKVPCYDGKEKTALHVAAEQGHAETVYALLEYCGAAVDSRDGEGETPLHSASLAEYDPLGMKSKEDYTETVKVLLNYGAQVNIRNARGETALHLAARNEFQKTIEVLILAGADPLIEDNDRNKAIDLVSDGDTVSKQILKAAAEDREKYMNEAIEVRAKGFVTSMQRQIPLFVRSPTGFMSHNGSTISHNGPMLNQTVNSSPFFSLPNQQQFLAANQLSPTSMVLDQSGMPHPLFVTPNQFHNSFINTSYTSSLNPNFTHSYLMNGNEMGMAQHSQMGMGQLSPGMTQSLRSSPAMMRSVSQITPPEGEEKRKSKTLPTSKNNKKTKKNRKKIEEESETSSITQITQPTNIYQKLQELEQDRKPKPPPPPKRAEDLKPIEIKNTLAYLREQRRAGNIDYEPADKIKFPKFVRSGKEKPLNNRDVAEQSITGSNSIYGITNPPKDDDDDEDTYFDDESFDTLSEDALEETKAGKSLQVSRTLTMGSQGSIHEWIEEQVEVTTRQNQRKGKGKPAPPVKEKPINLRGRKLEKKKKSAAKDDLDEKRSSYGSETTTWSAITSASQVPPRIPPRRQSSGSSVETVSRRAPPPAPGKTGKKKKSGADEHVYVNKIMEVQIDDKPGGRTLFKITPVNPKGPSKSKIIPTAIARRTEARFDDDAFVDAISQGDFSWTETLSTMSSDVSDIWEDSESYEPSRKYTFVRKDVVHKSGDMSYYWEHKESERKMKNTKQNKKTNVKTTKNSGKVSSSHDERSSGSFFSEESESESEDDTTVVSARNSNPKNSQPQQQAYMSPIEQFRNLLIANNMQIQPVFPAGYHNPMMGISQNNPMMGFPQNNLMLQQQPIVFQRAPPEKADSIIGDYAYQKSIADLNSASADNILDVVGRRYDEGNFREGRSLDALEFPNQGRGWASEHQGREASYGERQSMVQNEPYHNWDDNINQNSSGLRLIQTTARTNNSQSDNDDDDDDYDSSFDDEESDDVVIVHNDNNNLDRNINKHTEEDIYIENLSTLTYKGEPKLGFTLCGGNTVGIFVNMVEKSSNAGRAGLQIGDQIVKIGSDPVRGKNKDEVVIWLQREVHQKIDLTVDRNENRYKQVLSTPYGDSFHVLAHFTHTSTHKKELNVAEGDIFHIVDTLPDEAQPLEAWLARKLTASSPDGEMEGLIPSRQKAAQLMLKQKLLAGGEGEGERRGGGFMRSFRRSKSVDRNTNSNKEGVDASTMVPYDLVQRKNSTIRRPIVILGLFCEQVREMLIKDSPGLYELPASEVEKRGRAGGSSGSVASVDESSGMLSVDIRPIRSIVARGRHCLMSVSPKAILYLKQSTEFNPIVIYLSPISKNVIKAVRTKLAPSCERKLNFMYEEAVKFEKQNYDVFDAIVPYKADGSWFSLLKDTVDRIQRLPNWEVIPPEPEKSHTAPFSQPQQSSPPDLIRNTKTRSSESDARGTGGDRYSQSVPDQIQDLLSRHANSSPHLPLNHTRGRGQQENIYADMSGGTKIKNKSADDVLAMKEQETSDSSEDEDRPRSILKNKNKSSGSVDLLNEAYSHEVSNQKVIRASNERPSRIAVKPPKAAGSASSNRLAPRVSAVKSKKSHETQL